MTTTQTCPRRMDMSTKLASVQGEDSWREDSPGYRTCSFCGSLHPEDFLHLVSEGAEVGPTDKSYKVYVRAADQYVRGAGKFYTQHFKQGGGNAFRAMCAADEVRWGYPGHLYVSLFVPESSSQEEQS